MAFIVPFIPYIVGAVGALYAAQQQSAALEYQAKVNEQNAKLTQQQTFAAEESRRRQMALAMGDIRSEAVASGFSPGGGSLLNLQAKSAAEMELDILTSRYRGELESLSLNNDAQMQRANAKSSRTSGYLNAAGYLASGYGRYTSTRINQPAAISHDSRPNRGGY
jgi:hypothetical protein